MPDDKWEEFEDISGYSDTGTRRGWKVAVIILSVLVVLLLTLLGLSACTKEDTETGTETGTAPSFTYEDTMQDLIVKDDTLENLH